jgi:hypothetical protein
VPDLTIIEKNVRVREVISCGGELETTYFLDFCVVIFAKGKEKGGEKCELLGSAPLRNAHFDFHLDRFRV